MAGTSTDEMRNALQLCLRSMTAGCRFNIVGFGSSYQSLFPASRAYDQATLELATAHVADIEADLGSTELLPALRFVLEGPRSGELPRHVVVLTDGEVTNTVIELGAAHAHEARIFTFGIGYGASQHLVRGLARAGGGAAEFIYPGERIEPKVVRQLSRLLSPALTEVRLEWIGGTVAQAPTRMPAVFAGGRLLVYGFVKDRRPGLLRLTATTPSGPVSFEVPVPDDAAGSHGSLRTLAARARIRELEEGSEWLSARGSQQRDRKVSSARNEIVALSLRYGVLSRETSFVAVERRDTPVLEGVKLRKVPIALTTGWGGLPRPAIPTALRLRVDAYETAAPPGRPPIRPGSAAPGSARSTPPVRMPFSSPPHPGDADFLFDEDDEADEEDNLPRSVRNHGRSQRPAGARPGASQARPETTTADSGVVALIVLQGADGPWDLTVELASLLGRDFEELRAALPAVSGSPAQVRRVWATALAIAWLERHAADREGEWHLVAEKGRNWILQTRVVPSGGRPWTELAAEYLAG
jgi:Ca-activated chloride channel family protein